MVFQSHASGFEKGAIAALGLWVAVLYAAVAARAVLTPGAEAPFAADPPAAPVAGVGAGGGVGADVGLGTLDTVETASVSGLLSLFESVGYDWPAVRRGEQPVPPLYLAALPPDIDTLRSVEARKAAFFRTVLPLVLRVNDAIQRQRTGLLRLRHARMDGRAPTARERAWLTELATRYGVEGDDPKKLLGTLLRRVDIVPVSLALAQAAKESGWGTSRFAREGNAIFGQWTWTGPGLVPRGRPDGATYRIRSFARLIDSVRAYAFNLNSHAAYRDFRAERAAMRAAGAPLDGDRLAGTMIGYSETGEAYVEELRAVIRGNRLNLLDRRPLYVGTPEVPA